MDIHKLQRQGIKAFPVSDHIYVIQGHERSRSPYANSILVLDKINMLMDTGCGIDLVQKLVKVVPIDLVINSHSHPDHTGGNWVLQREICPEIMVPVNNAESIGNADKLALRLMGKNLAGFWKNTHLAFINFRDFKPTATFGDGEEFHLGSLTFVALHTPGHLNDHYCLWEPNERIFIGFDIDLSPFGPWYGDPESDIQAFKASIQKIRKLPIDVFISSHARPLKNPYFLKRMIFYEEIFLYRDRVILGRLDNLKGKTLGDLVKTSPIYGYDYNSQKNKVLFYGETNMVKKHLELLIDNGKIVCTEGIYRKCVT